MTYAEKVLASMKEKESSEADWWNECIAGEGYSEEATDFLDCERSRIAAYNDGSYLEDHGPRFEAKEVDAGEDVSNDGIHVARWDGKKWNLRAEFYVTVRLVEKDKELVRINAHVAVEEDGDPDVRWFHPLTGAECNLIGQAFVGWSERNADNDILWAELVEAISNDDMLEEKLASNAGDSYIDYEHNPNWEVD